MTARTDIHRPSQLIVTDYEFVGFRSTGDWRDFAFVLSERQRINSHMERTGGKYSTHAHGGSCHICGAAAMHTAIFHHAPSNVYICTGLDCAGKLECGDVDTFKREIRTALEHKAGKMKAKAVLERDGIADAWAIYAAEGAPTRNHATIKDIVGRLVKYGSISAAQTAFVGRLLGNIRNAPAIEAQRAAEREAAKPVPVNGERITVRGVIVSIKRADPQFDAFPDRMLVKHADGWKVWGTLPGNIAEKAAAGAAVEFSATVKRSDKDEKFGFFSRPTKAALAA